MNKKTNIVGNLNGEVSGTGLTDNKYRLYLFNGEGINTFVEFKSVDEVDKAIIFLQKEKHIVGTEIPEEQRKNSFQDILCLFRKIFRGEK